MQLDIRPKALADIKYWQKNSPKTVTRIFALLENIQITPFDGIGKPKPLRENLSGKWSRRITQEHRLIYEVKDTTIIIFSCRFHYE